MNDLPLETEQSKPSAHALDNLPTSALLQLSLQAKGGSVRELAQALQISVPYASMLLRGQRHTTPAIKSRLIDSFSNDSRALGLQQLIMRLERALGRALTEGEILSLIPNQDTQASLLSDILAAAIFTPQNGEGAWPQRSTKEGQSFDVASALAGLTSLADILVEEPDLPPEQRVQFQKGVQTAAERLRALLTDQETNAPDAAPAASSIRPDRYVDEVFLSHGYYFEELEREADLIVRRARRHGPLGTFALVARLEHDHGRSVAWVEGAGMGPSAVGRAVADSKDKARKIELDPSLGQSQLRFRLSQFLVAQEAASLLHKLVESAAPPTPAHAMVMRKALVAYTAAAMFMPYGAFLEAAQAHRYDIDWLARHFGCSFDQVCHRLVALRNPDKPGIPFGMLRISPAGQTITRIALPGLPLPDRQAACPLWAAFGALQRPGETLTQLAEFPDQNRFLFIGRTAAGPRAHYGQPRRLTSVMLACDWAYAGAMIYADSHDPNRHASMTHVGSSCVTCPRTACANRVEPQLT